MNRLRLAVAWIIVGAWIGSLGLDAFIPEYDAPATTHALMMIVAGFLFGPTIMSRGKKNGDE